MASQQHEPTPVQKDIHHEADEKPTENSGSTTTPRAVTENVEYPTGLKFALLLTSLFTTMFLVTLDRSIISTAIPRITDDFNSVTDIGWYGSSFLLTSCAFQPLFGKIYSSFNAKTVLLVTVSLFEIGSAISGAAPNSVAFIIGRAISGLGAAGILTGVIVAIVAAVPLHKRPLYQGFFGALFGLSSVIAPLLGGAFTTNVTWRWCFYINLPLGGVAMIVILLLLKLPDRESTKLSMRSKLAQLDVYGTSMIVPGSICLLLALQWGGLAYPWGDGRLIALLVLASGLFLGFTLVQVFRAKTATIPPRVFMQRSMFACFFATICNGGQMMIFTYYLPVWFQAIQGVSAVDSGVHMLPLIISMVISTLVSGGLVRRIGYYTPFMIGGACLMSIGAGLLYTLEVNTSTGKWIGYQIIYGFGVGSSSQVASLAAQTVLPKQDIPVGTSLVFFSQLLGGAIFLSVGQNVLENQLLARLSSLPGFTPELIQSSGATTLTDLPASIKPTVLAGYNESLRQVFLMGLVLACITVLSSLGLEWRSVKNTAPERGKGDEEGGGVQRLDESGAPQRDGIVPEGQDKASGNEV